MSPNTGCEEVRAYFSTNAAMSLNLISLSSPSVILSAVKRHLFLKSNANLSTTILWLSRFSISLPEPILFKVLLQLVSGVESFCFYALALAPLLWCTVTDNTVFRYYQWFWIQ